MMVPIELGGRGGISSPVTSAEAKPYSKSVSRTAEPGGQKVDIPQ